MIAPAHSADTLGGKVPDGWRVSVEMFTRLGAESLADLLRNRFQVEVDVEPIFDPPEIGQ